VATSKMYCWKNSLF